MIQFIPPLLYLLVLVWIIFRIHDREGTAESFYFASRGIGTRASIISIVATETSVATILIFPAVGFRDDLAIVWLCAGYIVGRTAVAYFVLERIHRFEGVSLYGFLAEKRAAPILSLIYLAAKYISGGVRFYMAAYAIDTLIGGGIITWVVVVGVITGLYSLSGGLKSVVLTDQIQGTILFLAGIWFCWQLFPSDPGMLVDIRLYQPLSDTIDGRGSIFLFLGAMTISLGSHGADQDMLQRLFAVRNLRDARRSLVISGLAASVVILLFAFCGMLLKQSQIFVDPVSPLVSYVGQQNEWTRGIFLVLLLAASMSTLDSAMHATGAVIKDLSGRLRPGSGMTDAVRRYSLLSLLLFMGTAMLFISIAELSYSGDFLGLAMGSMNYVYGGLIGILMVFVSGRQTVSRRAIIVALVVGMSVTASAELYGLYWPLITALSAFMATICGYAAQMLTRP